MKLAPIALFVYNRPQHTRLTVEALQKNELAGKSDLVIFSDGPKTPEAAETVREVREYLKTISGFRSVSIVERAGNFGLAHSIISGVTSLVNEYGRIIVLEDDLITSPYFLTFMNDALDVYQSEDKIMHISGYMFPIDVFGLPETFFLRTASCWGWATWDRAWKYFSKEPQELLRDYSEKKIKVFNMDGACNFWAQVEQNESGLINTWAVFWYASVFRMEGLCLHPAFSMVNNIGHDATGEHCGETSVFSTVLAKRHITYFEKNIIESILAHTRTKKFFQSISPSIVERIVAAIKRRVNA
jgi:hypothetical protein